MKGPSATIRHSLISLELKTRTRTCTLGDNALTIQIHILAAQSRLKTLSQLALASAQRIDRIADTMCDSAEMRNTRIFLMESRADIHSWQ
jgi:hypothetical protein